MLILKTLALEPMHGYGIGVRLEQISRGVFHVNAGSLFPALRRLERDGLIVGAWRTSENNRRAKYDTLTAEGRAGLKRETRDWELQTSAIARILKSSTRGTVMRRLNRLVSGLRALIWKNRVERELDEELRAYLDMAIEQKISSGLPREVATRTARVEVGSVEAIKERVRDVGWEAHIDSVAQDLRFGVRSFLRTPGFTVPALLTLALGVGATAAMFSVIRTVMLEPLPYREPERIVAVWETTRGGLNRNSIAPANFVAWRERVQTLEHLAMVGSRSVAITLNGEPLQIAGLSASSEVFRALGVAPARGRAYTAAEDGGTSVMVLSHEFWQRALGGRPDVLDLTLTTDGERRTVIGIMPPRFTIAGQHADFLMPYGLTTEQLRAVLGRGGSYAIARLRDGLSFDDASTEMRAIYAALEREEPQRNAGRTVMLFRLQDQMVGEIRPALLTLAGAVALVLVVACVNVANLLLARSAARTREVGMRGRWRAAGTAGTSDAHRKPGARNHRRHRGPRRGRAAPSRPPRSGRRAHSHSPAGSGRARLCRLSPSRSSWPLRPASRLDLCQR